MNEIFNKFKKINFGKKNVILIAVSLIALFVILISEIGGGTKKEEISTEDTGEYSRYYIEETSKELENLLEKIDGAGNVRVMITLESCYENVYAKGYNSKTEDTANGEKDEREEEYITVKQGANNEECLVVKVYEPKVKGVAVVAEGAGNARVKSAVTETVCALFDISSAKVSVEEMTVK